MTEEKTESVSPFAGLATMLPAAAGHLGTLAGSFMGPLLDRLERANREIGKAESTLRMIEQVQAREGLIAAAKEAAQGPVEGTVEVAPADPSSKVTIAALRKALDQLKQANNERLTLESLVMVAIDNPDEIVVKPHEAAAVLGSIIESRADMGKLSDIGRERLLDAVNGWTAGQRWRAKRWADIGASRGDEPPRNVAALFTRILQNPLDGWAKGGPAVAAPAPKQHTATGDAVRVYEGLRARSVKVSPPMVAAWTDEQLAEARQWLSDPDGQEVPEHISPLLALKDHELRQR